jgi:hypothetical protein
MSEEPMKKTKVRFLADVPEFVGMDLKTYGSFKKEDIDEIPESNAKLLIENKFAESCKTKEEKTEILEKILEIIETKKPRTEEELTEICMQEISTIPATIKNRVKQLKESGDIWFDMEDGVWKETKRLLAAKDLLKILGTTVKHDNVNKLITFFSMLVAYTEESQFNVSFRAPSSTGKSYLPLELSQYFPPKDVVMIAYSSPTSFYHDSGNWDNEKQAIIIDLEKKILIFLDQPHDQLLQRLRPLLSHDKKELLYKITDKRERKGLRTKNVIIRGFPSVIFCTGSLKIDEQEATRNFILSPETSTEKIREGIYLKALRKGNPLAFQEFLKQHPEREMLKERIRKIKESNVKYVIIKNADEVVKKFAEKYPKLKPRHQRDIERIISLIQGLALFNLWHRERDEQNNIYANDEDVDTAFEFFDYIAESQELGIPPYVYNIFKEVIEPAFLAKNKDNLENPIGLTRKEIITKYYETYGRPIQDWFLRQEILPALTSAGLVSEEDDPNDRRKKLLQVTPPPSNSLYLPPPPDSISENYSEYRSGVMRSWFTGKCSYCGIDTEVTRYDGHFICKSCLENEKSIC